MIENAFGRLKRRFAILHSEARLTSQKVAKVVAACIVLHNIATDFNMCDNNTSDIDFEDNDNEHDLPSSEFFPLNSSEYRDVFAQNVFG